MTDEAETPENPPAFGHGSPEHGGHPGMSLEDYYAGQALMGLMARVGLSVDTGWQEDMAWRARSVARAMLAERERNQ